MITHQTNRKMVYKSIEALYELLHLNRNFANIFRDMKNERLEKPPIKTATFKDNQNKL
jgi:hypothetical protein